MEAKLHWIDFDGHRGISKLVDGWHFGVDLKIEELSDVNLGNTEQSEPRR